MLSKIVRYLSFLVFLSTILYATYSISYSAGYSEGQASQLYIKIPKVNPSPSAAMTNTPKPTEKAVAKINKVTWGGPELWEEINKGRVRNGVNPLNKKDELCTIASIRLNELRALGKLDGHEGFSKMPDSRPDLKWIFEKYNIAEYLIVGYETPDAAVSAWEHTLGHKSLLAGGEWVWGCVYAQDTYAVAITAY